MTTGMARARVLLAALAFLALLPATPAAASDLLVYHLRGVGNAEQVVAVVNDSWSSTYATLEAFSKRGDGSWVRSYGPWTARVGRNGFGSPKREGDGQTPVGSYGVHVAFGTRGWPATHLSWRTATRSDVWVDDPGSRYYNTWQRLPANGRWRSAESLYQPAAYAYAAAIDYNLARKPGAGSAIFFHVTTGRATAGCVAVTQDRVVAILRWLASAKHPRFVVGPRSAVTY